VKAANIYVMHSLMDIEYVATLRNDVQVNEKGDLDVWLTEEKTRTLIALLAQSLGVEVQIDGVPVDVSF
jgi:hypothetical protein